MLQWGDRFGGDPNRIANITKKIGNTSQKLGDLIRKASTDECRTYKKKQLVSTIIVFSYYFVKVPQNLLFLLILRLKI